MKRAHWFGTLTLVFALASSSLGVVGCTQDTDDSAAVDLALAHKLGAEKIATERCSTCHSATRSLAWRTSDKVEAARLVDSMVARGATLSPKERAALIAYFVRVGGQ